MLWLAAMISPAARMVREAGTTLPTSFDNDGTLYGINLFLMTAFMCLGMMMAGAVMSGRRPAIKGDVG